MKQERLKSVDARVFRKYDFQIRHNQDIMGRKAAEIILAKSPFSGGERRFQWYYRGPESKKIVEIMREEKLYVLLDGAECQGKTHQPDFHIVDHLKSKGGHVLIISPDMHPDNDSNYETNPEGFQRRKELYMPGSDLQRMEHILIQQLLQFIARNFKKHPLKIIPIGFPLTGCMSLELALGFDPSKTRAKIERTISISPCLWSILRDLIKQFSSEQFRPDVVREALGKTSNPDFNTWEIHTSAREIEMTGDSDLMSLWDFSGDQVVIEKGLGLSKKELESSSLAWFLNKALHEIRHRLKISLHVDREPHDWDYWGNRLRQLQ